MEERAPRGAVTNDAEPCARCGGGRPDGNEVEIDAQVRRTSATTKSRRAADRRRLSARESQRGSCRGLSDKEIAQKLSLSARTVHHHVEHIYEKTGVSGRAAAALYAVRHDLISANRVGQTNEALDRDLRAECRIIKPEPQASRHRRPRVPEALCCGAARKSLWHGL